MQKRFSHNLSAYRTQKTQKVHEEIIKFIFLTSKREETKAFADSKVVKAIKTLDAVSMLEPSKHGQTHLMDALKIPFSKKTEIAQPEEKCAY